VYGKPLPTDKVLLKLRQPGERPTWELLDRDTFERAKYFSINY
jgi:hypothetical protein